MGSGSSSTKQKESTNEFKGIEEDEDTPSPPMPGGSHGNPTTIPQHRAQPTHEFSGLTLKGMKRPSTGGGGTSSSSLFTFEVDILSTTNVPYEVVHSDTHLVLGIELPGVASMKSVVMACNVTPSGYDVSIVSSAISPVDEEVHVIVSKRSTRLSGERTFEANITGVFKGRPECSFHHGVLKMRFLKRSEKFEVVELGDF
eukprot:PhF_6_TR17430/c0_g1_i1/m.26677